MVAQRNSYITNHGEPKEFYKDFNELDGSKYFGKIDYLHYSPPCQEFSLAGNRGWLDTDKGNLMLTTIKNINDSQPKMFTVENVPGLLSSRDGEDWKEVLLAFKSLDGYTISWHYLKAVDYGTPQTRERVFIVGFRGKCMPMTSPKKTKLDKNVLSILQNEDEVTDDFFVSDKRKLFIKDRVSKGRTIDAVQDLFKPCRTITARDYKCPHTINLEQIGNIDTKGHNSIWGRVYDTNGLAPTINAIGGGLGAKTGLFKMEDRIRCLTPRECARLMGDFDDKFKFGDFLKSKLYEFIGNAIDISTMRALLLKMFEHAKTVEWNEPKRYEFKQKKPTQKTLF